MKLIRKVNKGNSLYAKVHELDIAEAIKETYGIEVDSHYFKLKKKLGEAGIFVVPFLYKELKKEVIVVIEPEVNTKEQEVVEDKKAEAPVQEKTKEELKAEREAKRQAEKAEKIAKLKEKYK